MNERERSGRDPRDAAARRPAGLCRGPGHVVIYGNPAFLAAFGPQSVGVPAREGLLGLPSAAFALMDSVLRRGQPLASWIRLGAEDWRMTVAPRLDPGTQEVYGVAFHLRARSDLPIVASPAAAG
jgi:hypothetical protein